MEITLSKIWHQLQQSFPVEVNLNTIDAGKAVLEATPSIQQQDINLELIQTLVGNSSSLLDVLCLPLAEIVDKELSFLSLGLNLLNVYANINQKCPTLEEWVLIISQAAYLESTKEILSLYPSINWDNNLDNITQISTKIQNLQHIDLNQETAKQTMSCFHKSELAAEFNQILSARLTSPNITEFLANLLTERIAANTHFYMINAWIDAADNIQTLITNSCRECQQQQPIILGIYDYLKTDIATQTSEQFFQKNYSWKDIYIPLKAQPVNQQINPLDLETWVKGVLFNQRKSEKVMFIQGEPGTGKSVFCLMFADWVKQHLHPLWTPILINLKDIDAPGASLEDVLQSQLQVSWIQNNYDWLNNQNIRFLFILDGFDDLHIDVAEFLQQVATFQKKCNNKPEMGHRVLITGRKSALQSIPNLPDNLERVEILAMDSKLQEKWLQKWDSLPDNQNAEINFQEFVFSKKLPAAINQVSNIPLFLHLLAILYQEQGFVFENLEKAHKKTAKVVIFQQLINWLIAKQTLTSEHSNINDPENQNQQSNLKYILTETATAIVQSGGIFASKSILSSQLQSQSIDIVANLPKFCFTTNKKQEDKIECFHKTFSEYLFAEKLAEFLHDCSKFNTDEQIQAMNWQIYDLLGFGKITPEIAEYVIGLLVQIPDLYWINLFTVLEDFYKQWRQGKFIDIGEETLAQIKLRQLKNASQSYRMQNLGQRQVDIYAGLNVMILLLELQRYAQEHDVLKEYIIFYPSGQTEGDHLTSDLLRIINYCNCLQGESFKSIVGQFFSATYLRATYLFQADLSGINFNQADLSRAELSRTYLLETNLSNAYLIAAKLIQSDLRGANLSGANLIRTDLRGADLRNANFQDADLSQVDLSGANLKGANFTGAYLMGANFGDQLFGYIRWDKNTNWEDTEGLEAGKNLPAALKQHLGMKQT